MASKQSKLRVKHEEDEDGSPFTEEPQRQRSDDQAYVKKSKSRSSPEKKRAPKQYDSDDDEDDDSNEEDSEMSSFIAKDEEVEEELEKEREERLKKLRKKKLKEQKKRRRHEEQLDEEDYDIIRENAGDFAEGEQKKKKNRLRRTAAVEAEEAKTELKKESKSESAQEFIDTTKKKKSDVSRMEYDYKPAFATHVDPERLRQATNIFGEGEEDFDEHMEVDQVEDMPLEEKFNADEIDDPFSTKRDKQIAEIDIPERLQVKLQGRLKASDEELEIESEWILDMLTNPEGSYGQEYSNLQSLKGVKGKIQKTLAMLREQKLDVPMVIKYRKFEYAEELNEALIWEIFNLDQEFGRFQKQKQQIQEFLQKVQLINIELSVYNDQLQYCKTRSELNNYNALRRYLRSYYSKELEEQDVAGGKKKQPLKRDEIQIARENKLDEFAVQCFLSAPKFLENFSLQKMSHNPPEPNMKANEIAQQYQCEAFQEEIHVLQAVCKFVAIELASQPFIRNAMKKNYRQHGLLCTRPTGLGLKDIDIFHQSYRVKNIENKPLRELISGSDFYLDIEQCEKAGLIESTIMMNPEKENEFIIFLEDLYLKDRSNKQNYDIMRAETIRVLVHEILQKEIIQELREEIREEAENSVIRKCKKNYHELLFTGPFSVSDEQQPGQEVRNFDANERRGKRKNDELIKDRERIVVMGAMMHQIDMNNFLVTVAIVDKYGELIAHKDFMRLLAPRFRKPKPDAFSGGMDRHHVKTEEEIEHDRDRAKFIEMLENYSVDLIVVAANSLESLKLKTTLEKIVEDFKQQAAIDEEDPRSNKRIDAPRKEAVIIWGSTEVPKLFAMSHNSQKLHKNTPQMLKQVISLARFEQDPMCEVINLWSPITAENQALSLNLDPLQKLVNKTKLADALEQINIQVVNEIGIDLNLLIEHEHMQATLQFVSGLGPRKAKQFLQRVKGLGHKLATRGEIYKSNLLAQNVYISSVPFMKIVIRDDGHAAKQPYDILDQTRIHHEHYMLAMKIATDACHVEGEQSEVDRMTQHRMVKEVIANPQKLKNLEVNEYYRQLELTGKGNMKIILSQLIDELQAPFKDPRKYRTLTNKHIDNEKLFYLLIDENKRTFKKGMIVSATVTQVLDSKAICRLENGLTAIVPSSFITDNQSQKLKDMLDFGHIIQGRITDIKFGDEKKFEVTLQCKTRELSSHENYKQDLANSLGVNPDSILKEDLINQNFSADQKPKQTGRFVPRRIAHEKFKNISSRRALAELESSEVGDYVFRPSTRSQNAITLTWKFYKKQFVHIDIEEQDKPAGAPIGNKLIINNDNFENLREIVERYIIPCNRLVREVCNHPKFSDSDNWEELEARMNEEKKQYPNRIPYRLAIFPVYPQHVVIAYVPKEKVIKEHMKVRPRGFYFHDQNHAPLQNLINWFKDNWSTKEYQRILKRQKSPKTLLKAPVQQEDVVMKSDDNFAKQGKNWDAGAGSVHSHIPQDQYMKSENVCHKCNQPGHFAKECPNQQRKAFGRGQRDNGGGMHSPNNWKKQDEYNQASNAGNWGDARSGGASPAYSVQSGGGRGRGRGRGNGGGGGGNCFKCDQPGHMAKDCPSQGGGGGGGRNCFKCDQPGHMARECPNSENRGGGKGCFKCGEDGHMARDCPNPSEGGRGRGNREGGRNCYRCGQEGHMSRDCPNEDEGKPYKRQRGNEGGSHRRENDDGAAWNNTTGWAEGGQNAGSASAWGDADQSKHQPDASAWGQDPNPSDQKEGGW